MTREAILRELRYIKEWLETCTLENVTSPEEYDRIFDERVKMHQRRLRLTRMLELRAYDR